jgi:hypothetical protein
VLIIPGGTLLNYPNADLDAFIATVNDIKLYFQTTATSEIECTLAPLPILRPPLTP